MMARTDPSGLMRFALPALLGGALTLVASACKPKVNTFAPPPPPAVTVAHAVKRPVTRYLEYTGTTEAYQTVDLRARIEGFLEQVTFKPGASVKAGDLLFVIDKRTYQAAVEGARAQVMSDEAAFKSAETEARIAEELATQRAGSEIDKITKAGRRDSARAAVEASKAVLQRAELALEFCEVRSPIDGRITKNLVDIGNLVGAGGQPTLLGTVVSARPIYVSVDASEADVLKVRRERMTHSPGSEPGQSAPGTWRQVDIALADSGAFNVHGRVDYVDPALDPRTGTIRLRARFENEDELMLPGLFVRLRLLLETSDALLVPDIALPSDQNGRFALVVDAQGLVEIRRIKIGALDGAMRVVEEGLTLEDRIVVKGLQRARPGSQVAAKLEELDAPAAPAASTGAPR